MEHQKQTPPQPDAFAFVSDLTPNRATVEAIGPKDDLRAMFEDRVDGRIIEVPAGTDVGERVWL